jgi:hypothetical protein
MTQTAEATRPAIRPRIAAKSGLFIFLGANVAAVTVLFARPGSPPTCSSASAASPASTARWRWRSSCCWSPGCPGWTAGSAWTGSRPGTAGPASRILWTLLAHLVFISSGTRRSTERRRRRTGRAGQHARRHPARARRVRRLILVVGAASAKFARKRLAYETWHFIHLYTYAAMVLAFTHQIALGTSFASVADGQAYWWTMWLGRRARGARRPRRAPPVAEPAPPAARHRGGFRVPGRGFGLHERQATSTKIPAQAGQFFLWRFLTKDRWWQANPFSLSAAPDGRTLRLTAKALGDSAARRCAA